jgi:surface protein
MFFDCSSLETIDVSKFVTDNVENMGYLFRGCSNLASLNVESFNTENVNVMNYMFYGCSNLKSLNISNFSLASIERYDEEDRDTLAGLFNYTNKLTLNNIDMSNCDQETKTTLTEVFNNRQI